MDVVPAAPPPEPIVHHAPPFWPNLNHAYSSMDRQTDALFPDYFAMDIWITFELDLVVSNCGNEMKMKKFNESADSDSLIPKLNLNSVWTQFRGE